MKLRTSLRSALAITLVTGTVLAACGGSGGSGGVRNATSDTSLSLPAYTVGSTGITATQLNAINVALDPIMPAGKDLVPDQFGGASFTDDKMFASLTKTVDTVRPTKSTDDEVGTSQPATTLWDPMKLATAKPLAATTLTSTMTNAIRAITPGDTGVKIVTNPMKLEMYSPAQKALTYSGQIGTSAARTSMLGSYPLIGPGNTFDVLTGPTGKVASASVALRSYKAGTNVTVATGASAVTRCQQALTSANPKVNLTGLTLTANIVYFAPPLTAKPTTIDPVLQCGGTVGDGTALRNFFVTARLDVAAALVVIAGAMKPLAEGDLFNIEFGSSYLAANANGPLGLTDDSTVGLEQGLTSWGAVQNVDLNDTAPPANFLANDALANGVDTTDLMWYTGHANGGVLQGSGSNINVSNMRLGDADLEWLAVAACGPLQDSYGGQNWQTRLTPMFQGLHLLLGYGTVSYDTDQEGPLFARWATGQFIPGVTIPYFPLSIAWIVMAVSAQPSGVTWGVAGAQSNTGGTTNDCLSCLLSDVRPTDTGFTIWRLTGDS